MSSSNVKQLLTQAITAGAQLVGQFNDGPAADSVQTAMLFDGLTGAVTALPEGILGPRFKENILDWPKMWQSGEYKAARYQMVQLVHKLRHARDK